MLDKNILDQINEIRSSLDALESLLTRKLSSEQSPKASSENDSVQPAKVVPPVKDSYREVEGIFGVFDGSDMVTSDGIKHEVPKNYAAKSKLVFGDKLKLIEVDGKKLFKHVEKQERKKIHGILSRLGDTWSFVSDAGSYAISPTAAEFQKATDGLEAVALIPANISGVQFATLDSVLVEKPSQVKQKISNKQVSDNTANGDTSAHNDLSISFTGLDNAQERPVEIESSKNPQVSSQEEQHNSLSNSPNLQIAASQDSQPSSAPLPPKDLGDFNPRQLSDDDLR